MRLMLTQLNRVSSFLCSSVPSSEIRFTVMSQLIYSTCIHSSLVSKELSDLPKEYGSVLLCS